jgi:transcriptional regulator with XRE-family HTH domain
VSSFQVIGRRLQTERKRLNLSQEAFAAQLGICKRTQAAYEGGSSEPGLTYLIRAAGLGLDIGFILNLDAHSMAVDPISDAELQLIRQIRRLTVSDRNTAVRIVNVMADACST